MVEARGGRWGGEGGDRHDHGRRTGWRGTGGGGNTAVRTRSPEWAVSADRGARTAPRRASQVAWPRCVQELAWE